ncbi:hypothetical protein BC829DRAFT_404001, partial [Chytridium lagenaria]
ARIKWTPMLPAAKLNLFQQKVVLVYEYAFWKEKGLSGHALSHSGLLLWKPTLTAVVASGHGRYYPPCHHNLAKKAILDHLSVLFGSEKALHPIHYVIRTGPRGVSGGCPASLFSIRKPVDNIFFGGTETATQWLFNRQQEWFGRSLMPIEHRKACQSNGLPKRYSESYSSWLKFAAAAAIGAVLYKYIM